MGGTLDQLPESLAVPPPTLDLQSPDLLGGAFDFLSPGVSRPWPESPGSPRGALEVYIRCRPCEIP